MKTNLVQKWTGRLGSQIFHGIRDFFAISGVNKACLCMVRLILGVALSWAVIFGEYSPFGLGYIAAAGTGLYGLFSILGVILGYAFMWQMSDGLKYMSAAVLIFAAGFIFKDSTICKKPFFMPAVAAFMTACVGFVFVADKGFGVTAFALYITEIIISAGSAYFYRMALDGSAMTGTDEKPAEMRRMISVLVLAGTALITLSKLDIVANISVGRLIAVIIVLLSAYRGGMGMGSAAGISMGISMDVAFGGGAFFSMIYAFSGLLSGIFSRRGKLVCAITYVLSNVAVILWMPENVFEITVLYEVFVGSVIFILISDNAFTSFNAIAKIDTGNVATNPERIRDYAAARLWESASAFRELHGALSSAFSSIDKSNDNDVAIIFDRTSNKVCRKCAMISVCWEREYVDTFNSLNDAAPSMLKKGRAESSDFPTHFVSRCVNLSAFLTALNEELIALMYRRQFKSRLKESRNMVCSQYSGLSSILSEVAAEIGTDLSFDAGAERRLKKYIRDCGVQADAVVYIDSAGRMYAEIKGRGLSELFKTPGTFLKISETLGTRLCEPEYIRTKNYERVRLTQAEPLTAVLGIAANKKQGQKISGDCGSYFKNDKSKLFMMLSDGMGSGRAAATESGMAVRLLERFLRAGVHPDTALKTLNSALVLKGEDDGSFVTVDLFVLDLFTGEAELYKYGAAPSYIKKDRRITRITGSALPAGVGIGGSPSLDLTRICLSDGDYMIMISDGVSNSVDDGWLQNEAAQFSGTDSRELAELILKKARLMYGNVDDMTVMVLRMEAVQE